MSYIYINDKKYPLKSNEKVQISDTPIDITSVLIPPGFILQFLSSSDVVLSVVRGTGKKQNIIINNVLFYYYFVK